MQIIPLLPEYSQTQTITLGGQSCKINVYQTSTGLFLDLYVGTQAIVTGALCRDRNLIVRLDYLGFIGDLSFVDLQGSMDPNTSLIGTRWILVYFDPADL